MLDKCLLKYISGLSKFCHTGSLENNHSMLLKYASKRQDFTYQGMYTWLQMAAFDHNNNTGRSICTRTKQSGKPIATMQRRWFTDDHNVIDSPMTSWKMPLAQNCTEISSRFIKLTPLFLSVWWLICQCAKQCQQNFFTEHLYAYCLFCEQSLLWSFCIRS